MELFSLLFFLSLSLLVSSNPLDPLLPRPLILELPSSYSSSSSAAASAGDEDDTQLRCDSWRFACEANNLGPWKMIPTQCAGYVKDYMMGKRYRFDLEMVASEASAYARSVEMAGDGKDAWVFDVDETLLSNLAYYEDHGFG